MLVIKNRAGVPSVAKWIEIGEGLGSVDPPLPVVSPSGTVGQPSPPASPPSPPANTGGPGITPSVASTGLITAVRTPRRIKLLTARRRGLRITMHIQGWGNAEPRTVTAGLYRLRRRKRQALLMISRPVKAPGARSLTLPARRLRRLLRPGRYQLTLTVGNGRARRSPVVRRTIVVVR
jgi:hypothetical protein